jgi:peptidoglycan/xylan/chitin deacetylase (PgdA/CDA1 family)
MKALLKSAALAFLAPLGLSKQRAVILMYHSVNDTNEYFMNVRPEVFERHMAYLHKRGLPVISLTELVQRLREKRPLGGSVVITFDDGYRDNLTAVLPILKKYGFPATIFVTTSLIGATDKRGFARLSTDDMRELVASGLIELQPHTRSHPRLAELATEEARSEVVSSMLDMQAMLGLPCNIFAYPYGSYSRETDRIVRESGFTAACTVREGTVSGSSDPYLLPRVSIDSSTTWPQFKGKLSRGIDIYHAVKL